MLRVFVIVAAAVPAVVCGLLATFVGAKALYALIFLCFAPIFGIVYRLTGKRVERVRDSVPEGEGTAIPALMVRGAMQSPGIVTLGPESLVFRPVVGDRLGIRLEEIASVREVRWFNGALLSGKTGFWLMARGHGRLGCAVPNSYAGALRAWLGGGGQAVYSEESASGR